MSSNFQIDITSIGLKANYLYEILATTFSIENNQIIPNTASMGIRLVDKQTITIWPYQNTTTYKNIENNKLLVINLVDDVYLYAIASLKNYFVPKVNRGLTEDYYNYSTIIVEDKDKDIVKKVMSIDSIHIPYLKQAWAIIACVTTNKVKIQKFDDLGKSEVIEISLKVIHYEQFRESYKLYNRAENLALETIILATKLNVAIEKKDEVLIGTIKTKIEENTSNINRFGKNLSALKAIELVHNYIKGFGV
ncbi:MAG: DUF447 family protein [Candidatus Lokiarchaeota archaeon]|nr:DUF447 family protein [Candidatus Lokiarchaeota archaeon]